MSWSSKLFIEYICTKSTDQISCGNVVTEIRKIWDWTGKCWFMCEQSGTIMLGYSINFISVLQREMLMGCDGDEILHAELTGFTTKTTCWQSALIQFCFNHWKNGHREIDVFAMSWNHTKWKGMWLVRNYCDSYFDSFVETGSPMEPEVYAIYKI